MTRQPMGGEENDMPRLTSSSGAGSVVIHRATSYTAAPGTSGTRIKEEQHGETLPAQQQQQWRLFSGSLRTFVSLLTEVGPSLPFFCLRCSSSVGRESRPLPRYSTPVRAQPTPS